MEASWEMLTTFLLLGIVAWAVISIILKVIFHWNK